MTGVRLLLGCLGLSMTSAVHGYNPVSSPVDALPGVSVVLTGFDNPDSVTSAMSRRPLHRIEGVWRFPADGGTVAVERCALGGAATGSQADTYRMVIIRSANRALRPGTVMGYLWATAKRDVYDARLYTSATDEGIALVKPRRFTLTLTDEDSRLVFRQHRKKIRLNLWRLLPYMFRYSFSVTDDSPRDLDGCVRVFPSPSLPPEPRYL